MKFCCKKKGENGSEIWIQEKLETREIKGGLYAEGNDLIRKEKTDLQFSVDHATEKTCYIHGYLASGMEGKGVCDLVILRKNNLKNTKLWQLPAALWGGLPW